MRRIVLIGALVSAFLTAPDVTAFAPVARAQAPDPDEASVTLDVAPSEIPVNGHITLSGLGYPEPGVTVSVTVTPPTGAAIALAQAPDASGRYRVVFDRTSTPGTYTVLARLAAGAPARATFRVTSYGIGIENEIADTRALLVATSRRLRLVRRRLARVPPSPAKAVVEARLAALATLTERLPEQSSSLAAMLARFDQLVVQRPDAAPALQPLFDSLARQDADTRQATVVVAPVGLAQSADLPTCDAIDDAARGLAELPALYGVVRRSYAVTTRFATVLASSGTPATTGRDVATAGAVMIGLLGPTSSPTLSAVGLRLEGVADDRSGSDVADRAVGRSESGPGDSGFDFAVSQARSALPSMLVGTRQSLAALDRAVALAADAQASISDRLFPAFCEKLEGRFSATMSAHFFNTPAGQGRPVEWWAYTTSLAGTLVLRYPKDTLGAPFALSGELDGAATGFAYAEDIFGSGLFGDLATDGAVGLRDVPPTVDGGAADPLRSFATSPTSFTIPVTGRLQDGAVLLLLGEARTDFDDRYTRGHTLFVVISPRTWMRPVLGHFSLPFTNARFVLDQVVNGRYPVERSGRGLWIQRDTTRDRPANRNDAVYTLRLKACNPACGS